MNWDYIWFPKRAHQPTTIPMSSTTTPIIIIRTYKSVHKRHAHNICVHIDYLPLLAYFDKVNFLEFEDGTWQRQWSNKWFRSCDGNSYFFRDVIILILMEFVSELNGIVRFIVGSVCKQVCSNECAFNIRFRCRSIHWLFNKDFDQQIQWIGGILILFNV